VATSQGGKSGLADPLGSFIPQAITKACYQQCSESFNLFWQTVKLPVRGRIATLGHASVAAPHQVEFFREVAPSLHAVRDGRMPEHRRFWLERTKKASKDADLAVCLAWLIAFPKRPFYAQVAAADKDQAAIVRRRMESLLYYNDWLKALIDLRQYQAFHSGDKLAVLDILAADVAGSHGECPDMLVCNELSHVQKWEFIENLLDNANGVPQGLVIIATNAGFRGTKPELMRKVAIKSKGSSDPDNPEWVTKIFNKPAPWISKADLNEAKSRNTASRYKRLWWGVWVSGKGDAIDEDAIESCFHNEHAGPMLKPLPGWEFLAGIDLGVNHDHAGLAVTAINNREQRIRVARWKAWEPLENNHNEVDLIDFKDAVLAWFKHYHFKWVGYDPTQAKLMAQMLKRAGVPMREVSFSSPKNLTDMAEAFIQTAGSGKLECYDDEEGRLRRDFGKFTIKERLPSGYKLEAVSDEYGHADVGTALVITLPMAVQMLSGREGLRQDDEIASEEDYEDFDQEDVDNLPPELRDIFEASGDPVDDGDWDERNERPAKRERGSKKKPQPAVSQDEDLSDIYGVIEDPNNPQEPGKPAEREKPAVRKIDARPKATRTQHKRRSVATELEDLGRYTPEDQRVFGDDD